VRSRRIAVTGEPTAAPHPEQNRALGESAFRHAGHCTPLRGVPQPEQKFPSPGIPQDGHALDDAVVMVSPV
jgi:hypothetical protein